MKKCPYCAEEIQDDAIKCRYCGSDLTRPPEAGPVSPPLPAADPASAGQPAAVARPSTLPTPGAEASVAPTEGSGASSPGEGAIRFSHSGVRYVLGYGKDFFGIWDRQSPGEPMLKFPRTDDGWNMAWNRFSAWEPRAIEVTHSTPAPDVRPPTGQFRAPGGRSRAAQVFIGLSMLTAAVAIAVWVNELATVNRLARGSARLQAVEDARDAALGVSAFSLLWVIPAGIAWLMWQHRSHVNLRALGAANLKVTPGWAVGWWFVPFANIVMVYRCMSELWRASNPEAGAVDWVRSRATTVGVWWMAWLGANLLYQIPSNLGELTSIGELRTEAWLFAAAAAAFVLAGMLAIRLIRSIDRRQEGRSSRMSAWRSAYAVPS